MHFCLKMKLTEISVILGKKRVLLFVDFFCFSAQVKWLIFGAENKKSTLQSPLRLMYSTRLLPAALSVMI